MNTNFDLLMLSISDIIIISVFLLISCTQKRKNQLKNVFLFLLLSVGIWVTPLIFKILLKNTSINPYIFESLSGIGNYFSPVLFLALTNVFIKTKIKLKPKHLLLLIIPCISSVLLITNDYHHLLFKTFSSNFYEIVYGDFYYITIIYMYSLYIISMSKLLLYMIKNSGFFSKQSLCILIGSAIPLSINILGTLKIINITTYTTPITFSLTMLFYSLAIFKFNFLKISPIALQKIVDKMSDSYLILNENKQIIDYNKTFINTFNLNTINLRGKTILEFFNTFANNENLKNFTYTLDKIKNSTDTLSLNLDILTIKKSFTIEISNIFSEKISIGTLILLKDITQHKKDMEIIKNNQNTLIERERLASLGQMVGGIAHNLKTPIFSISGGLEGLGDLVTEFDESIEDDQVTNQDMHEIANDMRNWITKLKGHISYMSDVITAVKGQAVNFAEEQTIDFTVAELFQHVKILMQHEIKHSLSVLNISNNVEDSFFIHGSINSLVQVINNLISNAIEGYNGTNKEKIINLGSTYNKKEKCIILSVQDFGSGLPEIVQEKLFKEMITTKGKNGTGLGLFMSYSNIKAHFEGDMSFDTQKEKGTTFYIKIPAKTK